MPEDLKSKTILVRDTGYFVSFAERLARDFKKVYYHNPAWKMGSPKSQQGDLGEGVAPNIEVALDFWSVLKSCDMVACPDIYEGDITNELRSQGIPVFGSGNGEEMEIDRWGFKELLEDIGLPVAPSNLIQGVDELEEFLENNEDVYVKRPRWRGDSETWHHIDMFMSQEWFNGLKKDLGPSGEDAEFVIEQPIGEIEVGFDGIIMDGKPLSVASYGYEIKDSAHVAKFSPYDQIPKPLRYINDTLAPEFERYQYRGLYSNDVRERNGEFYLTDPCCRFASPVGELMLEAFENYSDIVWEVANGRTIKPVCKFSFGAALNLFSETKGWLPIKIPPEYKKNVKIHYWSKYDRLDYCTPIMGASNTVAVVIDLNNNLKAAIKNVMKIAEEVKMPGLMFDEGAFEHAEEQIELGRKAGISW